MDYDKYNMDSKCRVHLWFISYFDIVNIFFFIVRRVDVCPGRIVRNVKKQIWEIKLKWKQKLNYGESYALDQMYTKIKKVMELMQ